EIDDVSLVGICSSNPETKALVDPDCLITTNWRSLIALSRLDGVIVATPPQVQVAVIREAHQRRLPLMVEKPLTTRLSEALQLQELAGNSIILVDHTHLFHPGYAALKRLAAGLGPIRAIHSIGGSRGPF